LKEADQHPYLRQSIIQNTGVKPSVSIIVVNWNGKALLKDCLGALCHQTYPNTQIILVDNGSVDQSVIYVRENFPLVKAVELSRNTGFTGGNLAGLLVARGDFVALVNNDTRAQDHWLENLIQPMLEDSTVGICASKVLFDDGRAINSAGNGLTTAGVGFNRGLGKAGELFMDPEFVFGACGAAVLYRRKMLDEIGFLDEDFFLYDEDTDLSFRAHLAGWRCVYVPAAVLQHKSNATSIRLSAVHVYYHTRNLEFVWIKNMPALLMLRFAHHKLMQEIGSFCYLCLRHGKWAPYFKGKIDALKMLPRMWKKRRAIQARRRVPNSSLRSLMTSMFTLDFAAEKIRQMIKG
jgi:GT2 family glycosyltransferase